MTQHNYLSALNLTFNYQPQQHQNWGNLSGSSIGLVISQIAQQVPVMVVTPDSLTAQRLVEDIQFYAQTTLPLLSFPDWETLPYDHFSPHQDIISTRLTTLYHFPEISNGVLVLPITTLMHRLAPLDYVKANSLLITTKQAFNLEQFRQQLELSGYRCVSQVVEHGEFAIRGGLLDLFPMGSHLPYRLDLLDNEVDSIRQFDPETQRSQTLIQAIRLLPAREFPLTEPAINHFRSQWRIEFGGDPTRCSVYREISNGLAPAGVEYYLPLFFATTQTIFDYLPKPSVIATLPGVFAAAEQFWQEVNARYQQFRHDLERPILDPPKLFLSTDQVVAKFRQHSVINLSGETTTSIDDINFATLPPPQLPVAARAPQPLATLQDFLATFCGRILIVAETTGRRESLLELLKNHGVIPTLVDNWSAFLASDAALCLTVAPLEQGLVLETLPTTWVKLGISSLAVITETQLFGERVAQRRRRKRSIQRDTEMIVRDLTELNIGAPVVHEEHGVGRYQGLITLEIDGMAAEFLQLEYANQDKLYVPVASLHLISRFTGMDPTHAPLHRLGSGQWEKAKRKAAQQVTDVAVELLDLYARRAARQGRIFKINSTEYQAFAQTFPFEETADQQEAIAAVLADMSSSQPMDRLICGDVGFGKTEVAMRAAFVAVQDGQQVAVLVPTTLLAQQHHQTFQDRFADWAIRVEQLSRFRSKKQQNETLTAIATGQVDIVIGTHKLLQGNIQFKQLGLVIIDEEHRFGVKQKERFKSLRAEIDILTLTATPIPRSLNMALSNLRDLSIIATPPSRRLAIKTFIKEWQAPVIIEAILRELRRGGQVYFLHNDISTIEKMTQEVEKLVPEARIQIAHGKMRERELERVMRDFYHRRCNVLVCTTIIETGIDVPSANTIIINRADKLGLAQLYQLRGRVGRSHHRAYAYLIIPSRKIMTPDASKRIEAIGALEELGVGFTLATHDLEIRGAGELLGSEQSGHMQEIGYHLYTELLERAVIALKSGKPLDLERPLAAPLEINLHSPALLPSDYLPDVHTRLIMYKRIANAPNLATLDDIQVEMIDRFGLLPEPAKALIKITELRFKASRLGICKIDVGSKGGYILFADQPTVEPMAIVNLLKDEPAHYQLNKSNRLQFTLELPTFAQRYQAVEEFLQQLS